MGRMEMAGRVFAGLAILGAFVVAGIIDSGVAWSKPAVNDNALDQLFDPQSISIGYDKNTGQDVWEFYADYMGYTQGTIQVVQVGPAPMTETVIPANRVQFIVQSNPRAASTWQNGSSAQLPATTGDRIVNHPTVAIHVLNATPNEEFAVDLCIGSTKFRLAQAKVSDGLVRQTTRY